MCHEIKEGPNQTFQKKTILKQKYEWVLQAREAVKEENKTKKKLCN